MYDLLEPLDSAARLRAIRAVLQMFPEESLTPGAISTFVPPQFAPDVFGVGRNPSAAVQPEMPNAPLAPLRHASIGKRAQLWMRRHNITEDMLERVFLFREEPDSFDVELIAAVEGSTRREQAINCYLLTGLLTLLVADDPRFDEEHAVAICKEQSCYDGANHAQTRQQFGNRISGNKNAGWMLTTPGLDAAATVVKQLAGAPLG